MKTYTKPEIEAYMVESTELLAGSGDESKSGNEQYKDGNSNWQWDGGDDGKVFTGSIEN